jgi:chemotaxis protein methyltransferase CheR
MALAARRKEALPAFFDGEIPDHQKEFSFSEADFRALVQLAYQHAGIALADSKRNLVYGRLSRRLRALGMTSFKDYREYLAGDQGPGEIMNFINAISTNLTKFFREVHHFEHLQANVAAPYAHAVSRRAAGRLRLWSAGCSTGEEPYSIAAVLKREIRNPEHCDLRILATDIDTDVVARAARGEYPASAVDDIPKIYREFFPVSKADRDGGRVVMDAGIKSLISFRRLNLMEPWPFRGLFDVIFCRNVMIYFDTPTKTKLVERFTQQLKPGGYLYIGHSESLLGTHPGLQLIGRTTYRREA